jgi:alkaline phosphatase D
VVLWTRVVDPDRDEPSLDLELELAEDEAFTRRVSLDRETSRTLTAHADFDFCVKTRVTGLQPGATYYYRFRYRGLLSRVGRTKTAPAENADVGVRFAVVSCQDYSGKYFHCYRRLLALEPDVIVHLGDYVYETTGDPAFQNSTDARRVRFGKQEEALDLGRGDTRYQAAQSLDNYRDLYRLYRTDPDLQAAHERFAMIAIQDDHEFSDDCHGDVATYDDGRTAEIETDRRLAADQAWFEYMPVDLSQEPTRDFEANAAFPRQLSYYRSFVFGRHLELVMTDLRRYRPDHLVPEDAFPGTVFLEQAALEQVVGELPESAVPYVDIELYADGAYLDALRAGSTTLGFRAERLAGNISAPFINRALTTLGLGEPPPIDVESTELERGFAYHQLLKSEEFSRIGSRYVVALEPFEALAKGRFADTNGASEQLMGAEQRAWFLDTMKASTRTFKVWGSEICMMPRHIDLGPVDLAPPELRQRIAISAEDWDGFPNERQALLGELSALDNVVIVSGDLHCFFAGTPFVNGAPEQRIVEFVTGSISSTTWQDGLSSLASADSGLPPETAFIASSVGTLLTSPISRPNRHLAWQDLANNGFAVLEAGAERLSCTLYSISTDSIATPPDALEADLSELFAEQRFEVPAGSRDLTRDADGTQQRWDIPSMSWLDID